MILRLMIGKKLMRFEAALSACRTASNVSMRRKSADHLEYCLENGKMLLSVRKNSWHFWGHYFSVNDILADDWEIILK
jgi:hypothetical protein